MPCDSHYLLFRASRLSESRSSRLAQNRAKSLSSVFNDMLGQKLSANAMARQLNERGIVPARGGNWYPATVIRVLNRLAEIETPL